MLFLYWNRSSTSMAWPETNLLPTAMLQPLFEWYIPIAVHVQGLIWELKWCNVRLKS